MRALLLVPCVGLLLAADAVKNDAGGDQGKLQGNWKVVKLTVNGRDILAEADAQKVQIKFAVLIKGDRFTSKMDIKDGDDSVSKTEEMTFKLDGSKKPKAIDFTTVKDKDDISVGIYALEGDELKICFRRKKDRPTEFASPANSDLRLLILKRDKP